MLVRFGVVKVQCVEILENAGDGDVVLVQNISDVFKVLRWRKVLDTASDQNVL